MTSHPALEVRRAALAYERAIIRHRVQRTDSTYEQVRRARDALLRAKCDSVVARWENEDAVGRISASPPAPPSEASPTDNCAQRASCPSCESPLVTLRPKAGKTVPATPYQCTSCDVTLVVLECAAATAPI